MTVGDRTVSFKRKNGKIRKKYGCPYCSGKRIGKGINDLKTLFPEMAEEWHPVKNGELTPDAILPGSSRKIWWICKRGHEWQATPNARCNSKQGCPICYRMKRSPSVTCVETGEVYSSGIIAARKHGCTSATTIYRCCRGEIATALGYHWKYTAPQTDL